MSDVHLKHLNYTKVRVEAEAGIVMELADHLTFFIENHKFHPKVRAGWWDGRLSHVNRLNGTMNAGLAQRVKKFCDARGYSFSFDDELAYENVTEEELREFISTLNIPSKYEVRDYQFDSILKCIRSNRRTLVSPTSSGKSLMIYIICRWYGPKNLVIVPTTGLVKQMAGDFRDYGYEGRIHCSTDGLDRSDRVPADVVITTWQSLNNGKSKMPKSWYRQFNSVFGDEAHGAKAKCLIQIMESMETCKYRFGTTGTLDGNPMNEATIEGLFGPKYRATTTKELMDDGYVSKLKIKCVVLQYPDEVRKQVAGSAYHDEIDFITKYPERIKFVTNLALSLKGNKLVFFKKIDHGKSLKESFDDRTDRVFYIDGGVDPTTRDEMRRIIEDEEEAVLLASLGTTSTGVSINKLHHMIAAAPQKSRTKVPQSIGRMLRLHDTKSHATLWDLVDDLTWKSRKNFALRHFEERVKMYDADRFDYQIHYVKIK